MRPDLYFDQLIGISERLVAVLAHENDLLIKRKIEGLNPLQEEKTRLSHIYEKYMSKLEEDPELMEAATQEQKIRLKDLAEDFEKAATENLKNLKSAHETGARVLNAIRYAIEEQQDNAVGYSQAGMKAEAKSQSMSVSVDQRL